MARRKQNPETGSLLLLAGAAVAAYFAYTQGWFLPWFGGSTAIVPTPAPTPTPVSTGNPITSGAAIVGAPVTALPLGTMVGNASDMAAQVAAKLAYILPVDYLASSVGIPSGYVNVPLAGPLTINNPSGTVSKASTLYVRSDLANKLWDATVGGGIPGLTYDPTTSIPFQPVSSLSVIPLSGLGSWSGYRM